MAFVHLANFLDSLQKTRFLKKRNTRKKETETKTERRNLKLAKRREKVS